MAHLNEWQQYQNLRELITKAVEEANDNTPEEDRGDSITLAISPSLDEVYATYFPWWEDERLAGLDGWNIELAPACEPTAIAEYYFDLR